MSPFLYSRIAALWRTLLRNVGGLGLVQLALLQGAFWAMGSGLASVVGGLDAWRSLLFGLSLGGLGLGWRAAGRRRCWLWILVWFVVGVPIVFLTTGSIWGEWVGLVRAGFQQMGDWYFLVFSGKPVVGIGSSTDLALSWAAFSNRVLLYWDDVQTWAVGLASGRAVFRSGAVSFIFGAVVWALALWAGGSMRRFGNVLVALAPAGALLAAILAYARSSNPIMLALFLLTLLLLLAVRTQGGNEHRWVSRRMDYPEDLRLDFSFAASFLVVGVVVIAYTVPFVNLRTTVRRLMGLDRPSQSTSNGGLGESLGIEMPTSPPPYFDSFQSGGLPRSHLVGAAPEELGQVVMTVSIIGQGVPVGQPYYWRSLTYDEYSGVGWSTGATRTIQYRAGARLPLEELQFVRVVRQEYRFLGASGQLAFVAGEILSMDSPFEVSFHPPFAGVFDIFGVRRGTDAYTIDSQVPLFLEEPLRAAGEDYPAWVIDRYLALPPDIPDRVSGLAVELVQGASSPYDRARALEDYLRTYPYTLDVPLPPQDQDLVDYFLFDLQRGYCDYYASAMVVMARAVGLPARLAIGYAAGDFDGANDRYVVKVLDAHSWPEIYFPGFGWVAFEPTAARAAAALSESPESAAEPVMLPEIVPAVGEPLLVLLRGAGLLVLAGILLLAAWLTYDLYRLSRLAPADFFGRVAQQLYAYSRISGVDLPTRATPLELSTALAGHFRTSFETYAWLPGRVGHIIQLVDLHSRTVYSPHHAGEAEKRAALRIWTWLRIKIRFVRMVTWLQSFKLS